MIVYWKGIGFGLCAILTGVCLAERRDMQQLLFLCAAALIALAAAHLLDPIVEFLHKLEDIGNIQTEYLVILLRSIGIGFSGEIVAALCKDMGSSSVGKTVELLTDCAVVYVSIPMFTALLELIQNLVEGL